MNSRVYRNGELVDRAASRDQLQEYLADPDLIVLVDFIDPSRSDLDWVVQCLHLHPVAVTDALERHTRPKLERYDTHDFLYCYFVHFDADANELTSTDCAYFFTARAMVSVHSSGPEFFDRLTDRIDRHVSMVAMGRYSIVWGVLDAIVDSHFDAVQGMDDKLDELEGRVFGDEFARDVAAIQRDLFAARKHLVVLRRMTLPMREIVNAVIRDEQDDIPHSLLPYFSDAYDHALRVNEWVDSSRDLITSLLDASLTIQGNRMNLIMKKVTSWAAIIAVPTLITGFFGQNVAFFGFGDAWGLAISSLLIVASSVVLYRQFRRRDWL